MSIVAISGTQGCGKTTTINQMIELRYKADNFSTARYVQDLFKVSSLNEILSKPYEVIKSFQQAILEVKFERDSYHAQSSDYFVVERCFADIFAYASMWYIEDLGKPEEDRILYQSWVNSDFKEACFSHQREIGYEVIMLGPLPTFEADPKRAAENSRFRVHELIGDFLVEHDARTGTPFTFIPNTDKLEREILVNEEMKRLR